MASNRQLEARTKSGKQAASRHNPSSVKAGRAKRNQANMTALAKYQKERRGRFERDLEDAIARISKPRRIK